MPLRRKMPFAYTFRFSRRRYADAFHSFRLRLFRRLLMAASHISTRAGGALRCCMLLLTLRFR